MYEIRFYSREGMPRYFSTVLDHIQFSCWLESAKTIAEEVRQKFRDKHESAPQVEILWEGNVVKTYT